MAVPGARRQSRTLRVGSRFSDGRRELGVQARHKRRRRPSSPAGRPDAAHAVCVGRAGLPPASTPSPGWRGRRPRGSASSAFNPGGCAGRRRRSTLGRRCRHERRSRGVRRERRGTAGQVRESRRRGDRNAEAHEQLTASRARIVRAGDEERLRLERNLHDGAQQRLVALSLALRLVQSRLDDDPVGARAARVGLRGAGARARGAQRAGARDPPGDPHQPRAVGSDRGACRAGSRCGRAGERLRRTGFRPPSKRPRTT